MRVPFLTPPTCRPLPQMPPEELQKMHHIERHIRKNKLKVGAGCCRR